MMKMRMRTPAMPIFLPHHLLVLFSSREEGNSLAEAEAALSTRVTLHLGALKNFFLFVWFYSLFVFTARH